MNPPGTKGVKSHMRHFPCVSLHYHNLPAD